MDEGDAGSQMQNPEVGLHETTPDVHMVESVDEKQPQEAGATDTVENAEEEPKVKKICGAARRRYRILLSHGIPEEEARERAILKKMPTPEERKAQLKQRMKHLNNMKRPRGKANFNARRYMESEQFNFREPYRFFGNNLDGGFPVSSAYDNYQGFAPRPLNYRPNYTNLCHAYFPNVFMTKNHMIAIKRNLEDVLDMAPKSILVYEINLEIGWMRVAYANDTSLQWLKKTVEKIDPHNGVSMKIVEDKEFPTLRIVFLELTNVNYKSNAEILKNLKNSNPDLNFNSWRVLDRNQEGRYNIITFTMNAVAFEVLKKIKFILKYKDGTYTLRQFNNVEEKKEEKLEVKAEYDEAFFIGAEAASAGSSLPTGVPPGRVYDDDKY